MRWTRTYIPTLKEAPADAEVISHQLLIRAGMIRRLSSGIYSYLPLGLRAISKVGDIVREEMNRAGSSELLMPAVQPGELWRESGRWEHYGKELLRFKDRHERDCCLGPTHEEVITDLLRGEVRSYRQLPISLYQIQTKFRDEIRPRFGLMRGREFIMKDAYTFDKDDAGADASYWTMYEAYRRIFRRLALRFRAVEADSGSIGGSFSHEFMVLANTGEDVIVACTACEYAANIERAEVGAPASTDRQEPPALEEVATPGTHSVAEVAAFLGIAAEQVLKTILLVADDKPCAVLLRGDHELNEIKVKNHLGADAVRLASEAEVVAWTGAPVGFAGPVGLARADVAIIADHALSARQGWVAGANKADGHVRNLSLTRDANVREYADLRSIRPGEPCPRCGGVVETMRGIEVGHVFKLGLKYSKSMNAVFLDEQGRERHMVMGCYGVGVSRVVAACIEQNHDERGIVFPPPIAPYELILANLDLKNEAVNAKAEELYLYLAGLGLDVLLDDRDERPGVKFKDADLIGAPMQLVLGAKGFARGIVEASDRRSGQKCELPLDGFAEAFAAWQKEVYSGWGMEL
ncbi:proline--tRNA ligase [Desulfovibrio sp. OttesenSCG-928-A18]|nr:proline--tRNA ligase [Desulfovibrio sp. OttesenSCG-928-A18]